MMYEDKYEEDPNRRRVTCCGVLRTKAMKSTKTRVFIVLALGISVGLFLPAIFDRTKNIRQECQLPPPLRLNALARYGPLDGWTKEKILQICAEENSCNSTTEEPYCFHPVPSNYYYKVKEIKQCNMAERTDFSVYAKMEEPKRANRSKQVAFLRMRVDEMEDDRVVVRIFNDRSTQSFTPYDYLAYKGRKQNETRCDRPNRIYDLSHQPDKEKRLFVDVKRKGGPSLFNTNIGALIAEDQYLEITTFLPSNNVYGLGQGQHRSLRHNLTHNNKWMFFAGYDEEWGHGVHPFYLCLEEDGRAHGVLLEHTNAVEVTLQAAKTITYKSTGSSFVFHILMGPTPGDVLKQLTDLVGRPQMPPYWALGHHICRTDARKANETVHELREKKVPQESDCYSDTLSLRSTNSSWEDVAEFAGTLSSYNQKLILVQVPQVLEDKAEDQGNYVWLSDRKGYFVGSLRKKEVIYPNYFQGLNGWLQERLNNTLDAANVSFDGYLLLNNTPVDERKSGQDCSSTVLNFPSFLRDKNLWRKTLCLDTCHGGKVSTSCKKLNDKNHYNLHNIYGFMHEKTMYQVMKQLPQHQDKKTFLTSLSTFTGSGQYGGHFQIGFGSSWENMKISLIQSLEFNLFGIPMVGSPVCGYHFRKDRELCSRWTQLSAFQPLLISYHHDEDLKTPVLMDDSVASIAAAAFKLRYSLLPYLYTLFYHTSKNGSPVMRPVFFEFPDDTNTRGIDEQFMWGSALMVSPVMKSLTQQILAYFPAGIWYDFYTGDVVHQGSKGAHKNISAIEQHHINLHIRGGHIVVTQKQHVYTDDVRNSNHTLRVPLDKMSYDLKDEDPPGAKGELFIDDGVTKGGPSLLVKMNVYNGNNLTFIPEYLNGGKADDFVDLPYSLYVESVYIFGLRSVVTDFHCQVNGVDVKCLAEEEHSTLLIRDLGDHLNLLQENYFTWIEK